MGSLSGRNWAFDTAVTAAVVALGQLEVWQGIGATHAQGPAWPRAVAFGIAGAVLLVRRLHPLTVLSTACVVLLAEFAAFGSSEGNTAGMPVGIAMYSVARWAGGRRALIGLSVGLVYGVAWSLFDPVNTTVAMHGAALFWGWQPAVAWLVGALVRSQAQNFEQRRLRREERASRAIAEERNRIARELHDVIGHSVSVMTVQAAAVRRRLTPDQVAEREALETVESVGREALREMRQMVGVLREAGARVDRQPPPALADLPRLVEQFRTAGLPVEVTVTGASRPLAPGLDLTAYRLVQEGLTNALRHARRPGCATVTVAYGEDRLDLAVIDDGAPTAEHSEPGHGLLGMRERVSVYGGDIIARPIPGGGFELRASLPLVPA